MAANKKKCQKFGYVIFFNYICTMGRHKKNRYKSFKRVAGSLTVPSHLNEMTGDSLFFYSGFDTVPQCLISSKQKQKQRNKRTVGVNRMLCPTFRQHTTAYRGTDNPWSKIGMIELKPNHSNHMVQGLFVLLFFSPFSLIYILTILH